jgi:outer membrane protein OmpA-like peptidoglycan-associated protein
MLVRLSPVSIALFVVAASTACATKNFVRKDVKVVNDKVDTLGRSVEETQERTRKNEGVIGDIDKKTQAAQSSADSARQAAGDADAEAKAARARANEVGSKADDFDKAQRRLVYTVVLSEDQGQFKSGKAVLPDDAKAMLDELVTKLKADPNGAFFEIEGHTDALGTKAVNEKIGLDRAEAVKRYLFEQHQIPLHRMNVISYGMDKPVASNKTREGRAQNRRVVVRVLV